MTQTAAHPAPATCTITEAALRLGVARSSAYAAAQRGEIPAIRIGRRIVVPLAALEALLARAGGESAP